MNKYVLGAFSYGFIRKYIYTKDIELKSIIYDDKYINKTEYNRPILLTERLLISTMGGFRSIFSFPIDLFMDLRLVEMKSRNIKPPPEMKSNKDIHLIDVVFDYHY